MDHWLPESGFEQAWADCVNAPDVDKVPAGNRCRRVASKFTPDLDSPPSRQSFVMMWFLRVNISKEGFYPD